MDIIALPLSALMEFCYNLLHDYTLAIILFTLLTKIILLPISLWTHKNGIAMVRMTPEINRLKSKYFGDKDTIAEAQAEIYKREKYNPLASLIPLAIQIIILFGLVDVIHSITDSGTPGTEFLGMVPIEDGGSYKLVYTIGFDAY